MVNRHYRLAGSKFTSVPFWCAFPYCRDFSWFPDVVEIPQLDVFRIFHSSKPVTEYEEETKSWPFLPHREELFQGQFCSGQDFLNATLQSEAFSTQSSPLPFLSQMSHLYYSLKAFPATPAPYPLYFYRHGPNKSLAPLSPSWCLLPRRPKQIQLTWSFELHGEKDSTASILLAEILAEVVVLE